MPDLGDLYQSLILDHSRSPRKFGEPSTVDRVADVRFVGKGCAISQASASLMTTAVKGRSREEAERIFARFHDMVTGKPLDDDARTALGKLAAFGGVSRFPMRVKCASRGWHAMRAALHGDAPRVSTE